LYIEFANSVGNNESKIVLDWDVRWNYETRFSVSMRGKSISCVCGEIAWLNFIWTPS